MKTDFSDILKNRKENILKSYTSDIQKSEGSRGGKVIGHTKSGKPVYEKQFAKNYKDFTSKDHMDAAEIHMNSDHSQLNMNERDEAATDHGRTANPQDYKSKKDRVKNNTELPEGFTEILMSGGRRKLVKEDKGFKHEVFVKKDGTSYVMTIDKDSLSGPDNHSKTLASNISDDFTSVDGAIKYIEKYKSKKDNNKDESQLAKDWWNNTLSLNEQKAFKEKHLGKDYPNVSVYSKSGHNIIDMWKKEGSPKVDSNHEKSMDTGSTPGKETAFSTKQLEVKKAFDLLCNDSIEKGGEGSKGGRIIGHTKSGKAIYDHAGHSSHIKFDFNDHIDAANVHTSLRSIVKKKIQYKHRDDKKSIVYDMNTNKDVEHHDNERQNHLDDAKNKAHHENRKAHHESEMDKMEKDPSKYDREKYAKHSEAYVKHAEALAGEKLVDRKYDAKKFKHLIADEDVKKSELQEIEKAEGSRGGKVIGHTKSGKPIYDSHNHTSHKNFTAADHEDAHHLHNEISSPKYGNPENDKAKFHQEQADKHYSSSEKADEEADNTDEETMKAKKASIKKSLDLLCGDSIEKAEKKEVKKAASKKPEPKDDKFDHHRKMAGYHHLKAKAATDSAFDLNNSSDKEIQGKASESSKVAQHHTKMMEEHMERSKQLHDKEKHGDWNKTIPSASEAMAYGKKYDEDLNATKDSDKAVIEKKDKIKKALNLLSGDSIEKGGVGSGKHSTGINKKYTHFAIHKDTGKILNGWDYKHIDKEDMKDTHKDYSHMDLRDMDIDPKNVKIVSKEKLSKTIDPFHTDNWSKSPHTEGMEDSTKKE